MISFNSKLPNVGTTIFSVMSALANKHNAINLSQGFPNFPSDPKLGNLVTEAINSGYNQYAPMPGLLDLREAISNKFNLLYNTSYHPDTEITITAGATQAIFTAISSFINPNDEVIIFKPAYDCYEPTIELNKGKTISIQLSAPDYGINWKEVAQKINHQTKMIIINTPQNPSGSIFTKEDMLALEKLVEGTDIIIVSDEVYEHIVFDGEKHQSACLYPALKERSFIIASFGKTFHNTGWKIGYACAPKELMAEFRKAHQFNVFCVSHPMQKALANYLKEPKHYLELNDFYQEKRDYFLKAIESSRFKITPTKGTYFQILDYSNISNVNDLDFAKHLTVNHKIASIPLSVFNDNGLDDNVLRFCFAKTTETIDKAAEVINKI